MEPYVGMVSTVRDVVICKDPDYPRIAYQLDIAHPYKFDERGLELFEQKTDDGVCKVLVSSIYTPKHIYKGKGKTVVLWADGTKTIVKRAEGETDSDYAAFTAALAIKIYGNNSAVNRIVRKTEVAEKKRKKKREEPQKETQVTKIEFTISPENITISREEV